MKRKRRPRRHYLIAVLLVCLFALLLALAMRPEADVVLSATSECVPVNPQAVGNMMQRGEMVERCLEMGR